jgi:hypothetical protein
MLCEGDLLLLKRKTNEKEKETQPEKRHYFLLEDCLIVAVINMEPKSQRRDKENRMYLLKDVWPMRNLTLLTSPEPVEDDDKIMFDISVDKVLIQDRDSQQLGTLSTTIISDDQFFKLLHDQIDQSATKVFGTDLMKLSKRPGTKNGIPEIIRITTHWIKAHCTDVEGIFRKSGALAQVEDLKARFDEGDNLSLY